MPGATTTPRDIGFPGEFPYTRGVQPSAYRGRVWTMRQYSGYATAADTNRRYRYLLEQGQTGLSVAFDLPTQIGYDSDHPLAKGEVGKVGVPICSLEDMETLFDGIPLGRVSTSMTINATASLLLCFYIAAAKRQGVTPEQLSGTLQNDILKEYIARGTYAYPPRPSMRLVVDVFKYCAESVPRMEYHQHLRLPHAGGRGHGGAGTRVHLRQRNRLRASGAGRGVEGLTISLLGFPSSSWPRTTCSRKWPSSGPPAACGRESCGTDSGRRTRAR